MGIKYSLSDFKQLSKKGELLQEGTIKLLYPKFYDYIKVLQNESKTLVEGGVLAYAEVIDRKYDSSAQSEYGKAFIYICKKVNNGYILNIYTKDQFSVNSDLTKLLSDLNTQGVTGENSLEIQKQLN